MKDSHRRYRTIRYLGHVYYASDLAWLLECLDAFDLATVRQRAALRAWLHYGNYIDIAEHFGIGSVAVGQNVITAIRKAEELFRPERPPGEMLKFLLGDTPRTKRVGLANSIKTLVDSSAQTST